MPLVLVIIIKLYNHFKAHMAKGKTKDQNSKHKSGNFNSVANPGVNM